VKPLDDSLLAPVPPGEVFPFAGGLEEQIEFLLHFATRAPSTYNTQPWKFRVSVDGVDVFADYTRRMPVADPGGRELLMSIGAAVMNLRVAAAHFGYLCDVVYNHSGSSEEPLASVRMAHANVQSPAAEDLASLFGFITRRHTNRHPFLLSRIPSAVFERVSHLAEGTDVTVVSSTDGDRNGRIAEVVSRGDAKLMGDANYRRNIAAWLHAHASSHVDGLPAQAFGFDGRLVTIAPWATRVIDIGKIRAAHDRNLCLEAPGLIALCSEDSVPQYVAVGELLERMLLVLTGEGLHTSYFNMPIQVPALRMELQQILGTQAPPQLLLRVGYSLSEPIQTARRPLKDVILQM
jgi:hypothetical protein